MSVTRIAALLGALMATDSRAWVLPISPGPRALFLQVGQRGTTTYPSLTVVTGTVSAAQVGRGMPVLLVSDSTQSSSPFDGFAVCNPPRQVYVGGYFRMPGMAGGQIAQLSVISPPGLTAAGAGPMLPINSISWTSSANGNSTADIPSGVFSGGLQPLRSLSVNTWVENCLSFDYANTSVLPPGTYSGTVTYQLVSP